MSKLSIRVKESKKTEDSSYESIEEVFQELGYFPAEESDSKKLICYADFETGIDTPHSVSVIAQYYFDSADLLVEVSAGSYERTTHDGRIGDMFYTFIGSEVENATPEQVLTACRAAEKAANHYIKALRACKNYKGAI